MVAVLCQLRVEFEYLSEILRLKDWGRYVTLIVTTHCNEFVTKTQKNLSYVTTIFWALQNG